MPTLICVTPELEKINVNINMLNDKCFPYDNDDDSCYPSRLDLDTCWPD